MTDTSWTSGNARSPYWIVLGLVVLSYIACSTQHTPNPSSIALILQLVTVAVTLQVARVPARIRSVAWVLIGVLAAAIAVGAIAGFEGHLLDITLASLAIVAYLAAAVAIIVDQRRRRLIDLQTLAGFVTAYVMVGMMFTFIFNLIALVSEVPTFGDGTVDSLSSQLFFSFTTLTTTGYGNIVPVSSAVQSLAILEAITGQLFLIIGVARIVNLRGAPPSAPTIATGGRPA